MMYCLRRQVYTSIDEHGSLTDGRRSYIPLLLLPLPVSLSPVHLATLLALTYLLNRPCIYCSLLLVILFASSCHWSGKCLWDGDTVATAAAASSSSSSSSAAAAASSAAALSCCGGDSTNKTSSGSNCGGSLLTAAAVNASECVSLASRWAAYALPRLYTASAHQHQHQHHHDDTTSDGSAAMAAFLAEVANSTVSGLATAARESAGALVESVWERVAAGDATAATASSAATHGIGVQWLKNLLGRSEWTLPCIGVKVVL